MNYSELRAHLKSSITACDLFSGYKLKMTINGFHLYKETKDVYISFGGNTRKYPELLIIDYFYCGIGYKKIENLIIPILVRNNILGSSALGQPNFTIGIEKEFPELNSKLLNLPIEIKTTEDIFRVVKNLSNYFQMYVVPFEERWNDFSKLVPILEKMDDTEINDYFSTGALFRKIIIFKLVKHPDYTTYFNSLIDKFNSLHLASPDEPYYKNYLTVLKELQLELE